MMTNDMQPYQDALAGVTKELLADSPLAQYTEFYAEHADLLRQHSAPQLRLQPQASWAAYLQCFPSAAYREAFRYTDALKALAPEYALNPTRRLLQAEPYRRYRCGAKQLGADVLYVVNDVVATPPTPLSLPESAYAGALSAWTDAERFAQCFAQQHAVNASDDPAWLVNDLLAQDAVVVYVPDGVKLTRPLQIVGMSDATDPLMSNRRLYVYLGRKAQATLVVCDHAMGPTPYLTTQTARLVLSAGSHLEYYSLEETSAQTTRLLNLHAQQAAGSTFVSNFVTLRCGLSRNTVRVVQAGDDCLTEVSGALIADSAEHADTHVTVEHGPMRGGQSDLLFKQAVGGTATGAFTGVVDVRPGAAQVESQQQCQNMLLSDTAHVFARPVLKIYADDVKCSHGTTTGKFDAAALFYMQQRGISEAEAKLLLQHAFIYDALRRIRLEPLRSRLSVLAERRMRGGCDTCEACGESK
ncbi:MAG: SufD family Fe-S cluster assembly protein [Alloprevotella sp.]|nr:SufD family Fe-S cluster assembly protein [Alloprevotella sp.]